MKRVFLMLAVLGMGVAVTGCGYLVAAGVGAAGTAAYLRGSLRAHFAEDVPTVAKATTAALNDLGISVIEESSDQLSGKVVGRTADDTRIVVNIDRSVDLTTATIRYGGWGNEAKSRVIYDRIQAGLGGAVQEQPADNRSQLR